MCSGLLDYTTLHNTRLHHPGQGGKYTVYTAVSHYMAWVNSTILRSGGMEACGYTLQTTLQQGP